MVAALAPYGLDVNGPPLPFDGRAPMEALLAFCAEGERGFEAVFEGMFSGLPEIKGLTRRSEIITGEDGNDIELFIVRPEKPAGPLPCILHIHGGGMAILRGSGPAYARARDELAATGLVVVGVEFRNAAGALGNHPFPAGLTDCAAALGWVHASRGSLGASKVVVAGESGGANLSLATTLRAKQEGRLGSIDGVYAMVPYISGIYGSPAAERMRELPSLIENDGYLISCALMDILASVYDPGGANSRNPLCWPYFVSSDELAGLPPHVISVNELDPLRDEGLAYHRKLIHAGVPSTGRMMLGVCHAGDLICRAAMPDAFASTIRDIHRFASSV
jgi:acetyl esterase/lipase